jgi:hypothetical protein
MTTFKYIEESLDDNCEDRVVDHLLLFDSRSISQGPSFVLASRNQDLYPLHLGASIGAGVFVPIA